MQRLYNKEKRTPVEYKSLQEWVKTLIKNYIELEIYISQNTDIYPDFQITQNNSIFNEKKFTKYFNHDNIIVTIIRPQGYIDRLIFSNMSHCSIVDIKTESPAVLAKKIKKIRLELINNEFKGNSEDFILQKILGYMDIYFI